MCAPNNNEGLTLHQFKQLGNGESVGRGKREGGRDLNKGDGGQFSNLCTNSKGDTVLKFGDDTF